MKNPVRTTPRSKAIIIAAALAAALLHQFSSRADVVYVTSMPQGCTTTTGSCAPPNADGTYSEINVSLSNTGIKGSGSGRPVTANFSRYYPASAQLTDTTAGVDIKPVLALNNWVYQIDYNWNANAGNSTTNVVLAMTATGGVLSSNSTMMFQRSFGSPTAWLPLGFITNSTTTPVISFRYQSGFVTAGASARLLFDCWRFTAIAPCLAVAPVSVTGPLATNLTSVVVNGVSATATNLTLYQKAGTTFTNIGSIAVSSPGTSVSVPVTGKLVKGAQVGATQWIGGQEGCLPVSGALVGGGANPRLRVAASIRQPKTLTGPIGANGGGPTADIYWLHATGANVAGGIVLQPSTNWQTVVFYPNDPTFLWNNNNDGLTFPDPNQFGIFEGLGIAIDDLTDTGPYNIYIDNLRNGTTMIQDFENETNGATSVQFPNPSNSGTTSGNIMSAPNSSAIATGVAAYGTNSANVAWQWISLSSGNWLRLNGLGNGGNVPTPNPEVDLTLPIAVDILILPPNKTTGHSLGLLTLLTNQATCPSSNATFSVTAQPAPETGPYAYQWQRNGVNIPGATDATFTTNNVVPASSGTYSVVVSDGSASATLKSVLTVYDSVQIDVQPIDPTVVNVGDTLLVTGSASAPSTVCTPLPVYYQWYKNGVAIPGASGDASGGVSYSKPNADVSDAGLYTFVASNEFQSVTSDIAHVYVVDSANQYTGTGTGLLGLYYSNHLAAAPFTGTPAWTNLDSQINFDWLLGAPDDAFNSPSLVSTDRFTVRWVGQIQGQWNQNYTFYTTSDDGIRVWVDNQLVIDSWINQAPTEHTSSSVALTTNSHSIVVEYFENTGGAVAKLSWDSASQIKGLVPMSQLYPGTGFSAPTVVLTAPTSGSAYTTNATVLLSASVTTNSAIVNKVQFLRNSSTLIGESAAPPYAYSWVHPPAGTHNIFARVVYNVSSSADSSTSTITVSAPTPATISPVSISGGSAVISGTGAANQTFILVTAPDLTAPVTWTPVATNSTGSGSFSFSVPASGSQAFFKVQSY